MMSVIRRYGKEKDWVSRSIHSIGRRIFAHNHRHTSVVVSWIGSMNRWINLIRFDYLQES